ncbi:PorP/SprF family type IX secretion system membrane protein [Seonamhaeicola marinus]|uniref:Type IX secretion system membrane protein PorP/SprF n=1 Tax=Seonamhaeicola marinus TaxID=1912246 RepID=A0A5D0HL13_9FLAO|nr:type IX secretion system membrane protein PorP/SprF [Seonamhaeicola marinus]TYA72006.1 type IX secretion system membrane protein PorP/SprF [Seonamhaeicola marinus]
MQKALSYITFLLVVFSSYAQELNLPVYTQYLADNNFVISPTYAGIGDNVKIRANGLSQWVGIKNAPENQSFYGDVRIANRTGIGASFYNDSNGNTHQLGAKFSFAHHLVLDYYAKMYLSLGISYNLNTIRFDIGNFTNGNDTPVTLPSSLTDATTTNHNFDVGALFRLKGYFMSLNVNNILSKDFDEFIKGSEPELLLNYQVYTGYTFLGAKNSGLEFEPSIFYQMFTSDKRSSTDVNFKVRKYNRNEDYIWAGISYRFLNDQFFKPLNIGPMAGFKKSAFYFGYSYQITTNGLSTYNSGTHMITIGIDFLQGISNCPCTQDPVHH